MNKDEKLAEALKHHKDWNDQHMKNWRAWGSWFSWGSPIGLGLFFSMLMVSVGVFFWLWGHRLG